MADFKVIETQEQLNEVIGERLKRAEEKANAAAAEKYADYDSLKEKNAELTNQVEAFSQQIQELQEASAKNEQLIKEGAKYKTDLEKTKIALNAGLRIEYADRLQGETAEEWERDAEALAKDFAIAHAAPPLRNSEAADGKTSTKDQLQSWLDENF